MNVKTLQEKNPDNITTFQKIYAVVSKIPKGKVMTYKQVATLAGITNPRVVGFALRANKNPKIIPCHRVIRSNGTLSGYAFGGTKAKKEILEKEGIQFCTDKIDVVNFALSLYTSY